MAGIFWIWWCPQMAAFCQMLVGKKYFESKWWSNENTLAWDGNTKRCIKNTPTFHDFMPIHVPRTWFLCKPSTSHAQKHVRSRVFTTISRQHAEAEVGCQTPHDTFFLPSNSGITAEIPRYCCGFKWWEARFNFLISQMKIKYVLGIHKLYFI